MMDALNMFMCAGYSIYHDFKIPNIWVASCAEWRTTFELIPVGMN